MNKAPTTNEIMLKLSTEIINNPNELSEYLVYLTANLWKYGQQTIKAEIEYARKWQAVRQECETDGQANMKIKSSPEYESWKGAQVAEKTLLEIIRSLKKRLQTLGDEMSLSR
jgi:hypothetical protein